MGTIPNLGIPNRKLFEVFSKSVKQQETVARHHTNQTRGDSVRPAVQAGEGKSSSASQLLRAGISLRVGKLAPEPQNLTALAIDSSGHLVRKYRLTYHRQ
ncbi:hypothetical protein [Microcoleus vaginatus]|uniref:hypothetical protein n=1 Tax=Microcoleus vaginatus TaxID=119532 RepID=UPI001687D905|nr:hypothetical protein [Microcoleus sp. FACHB-84]MBD2008103.1 hypothetical protein [Microcoleus sp. FACHB-45]